LPTTYIFYYGAGIAGAAGSNPASPIIKHVLFLKATLWYNFGIK
jgi:hypothetical protein